MTRPATLKERMTISLSIDKATYERLVKLTKGQKSMSAVVRQLIFDASKRLSHEH